jgi:hypothetical protein
VTNIENDDEPRAATAARIYDYFLGGTHNFPADREAAKALLAFTPTIAASARVNRAFLRRAVTYLAGTGVRQFIDIGSGIPTAGNVHEVAEAIAPDSRVVYVDIDPVAVAESLDILKGNERATALRGDLRDPVAILNHADVLRLINFDEPIALLVAAVLHFIADDDEAYGLVARLHGALPPGSYLVLSHASLREDAPDLGDVESAQGIYSRRTATPLALRDRRRVERFYDGLTLLEPGVVWCPLWRPDPDDVVEFPDPADCSGLAGVARKS